MPLIRSPRRLAPAFCVLAFTLGNVPGTALAQAPANGGDVVVKNTQGDVRITVRGETKPARKDSVLSLPAIVGTGNSSVIELRQGKTSIEAAANTTIEIPAPAATGLPIERVIQSKGNAFYNVGKREAKKLRVETPYLVAVVKGTQFNVAVQDERTTISLFEGSLEIRSLDDTDVITLLPGQIATRGGTDSDINVIRMDTGQAVAGPAAASVLGRDEGASTVTAPARIDGAGAANDLRPGVTFATAEMNASPDSAAVGASASIGGASIVADLGAGTGGTTMDVDTGANSNGNATIVGVHADAGLTGEVSLAMSTGSAIDLGSAGITANATAGTSFEIGVNAASVDLSTGVDLGSVSPGIDVDLGGASASTNIDLESPSASIIADTNVAPGAGSVDSGVTITTPASDVTAGNSAAPGEISVSANIGGASAGLGVDLGGDSIDVNIGLTNSSSASTTPATSGSPNNDTTVVSELLDGVRGRRGRP